jgi:hypothetical protein
VDSSGQHQWLRQLELAEEQRPLRVGFADRAAVCRLGLPLGLASDCDCSSANCVLPQPLMLTAAVHCPDC